MSVSLIKGAAKQWDQNALVHSIWKRFAMQMFALYTLMVFMDQFTCCTKASVWMVRVPSNDNIADLPSREEYGLLVALGAQCVEAKLDDIFCEPSAWAALRIPHDKSGLIRCGQLQTPSTGSLLGHRQLYSRFHLGGLASLSGKFLGIAAQLTFRHSSALQCAAF